MALNNLYQLDEGLGMLDDPPRAPAKKKKPTTKRIVRRVSVPRRSTSSNQSASSQVQRGGVQPGNGFRFSAALPFQLSAILHTEDSYKQAVKANLEHTNAFGSLDVQFSSGGIFSEYSGTVTITGVSNVERNRIEDIRDDCLTALQNSKIGVNAGSATAAITSSSTTTKSNANVGSDKPADLFTGITKDLTNMFGGGGIAIGLLAALAVVVVIAKK